MRGIRDRSRPERECKIDWNDAKYKLGALDDELLGLIYRILDDWQYLFDRDLSYKDSDLAYVLIPFIKGLLDARSGRNDNGRSEEE